MTDLLRCSQKIKFTRLIQTFNINLKSMIRTNTFRIFKSYWTLWGWDTNLSLSYSSMFSHVTCNHSPVYSWVNKNVKKRPRCVEVIDLWYKLHNFSKTICIGYICCYHCKSTPIFFIILMAYGIKENKLYVYLSQWSGGFHKKSTVVLDLSNAHQKDVDY